MMDEENFSLEKNWKFNMDEVLLGEDDEEGGEWKYDLKGLSPVSRSPVPTWEPSPVDR